MPAVGAVPRRQGRAADLNLSPDDLATVKERAAGGCAVMGLRFTGDVAVGTRFDTLTRELGDAFIRVEFGGRKHSTVTEHRQQEGVDRVLAFFHERSTLARSFTIVHSAPARRVAPVNDLVNGSGRRSLRRRRRR